jgi:predicted HicB family RNase H-like nuclease
MKKRNNNTRTTIQIDLEDDLLFQLMLRAHEQDITLNQLVENILREFIKNNPLPNETGSTEE